MTVTYAWSFCWFAQFGQLAIFERVYEVRRGTIHMVNRCPPSSFIAENNVNLFIYHVTSR